MLILGRQVLSAVHDDIAHRRTNDGGRRIACRAKGCNDVILRPSTQSIGTVAAEIDREPAIDLLSARKIEIR